MGNQIAHKLWAAIYKDSHWREEKEAEQNHLRKQAFGRCLPRAENQGKPHKTEHSWTRRREKWQEESRTWQSLEQERLSHQWILQESASERKTKDNPQALFLKQD